MAIAYDQTINLRIAAETTGADQVSTLANEIEALGKQGGDAAPRFQALAAEIRTLGQQHVRITGLEAAITSAKSARDAVLEARHEVEVLDKALAEAKGAGANKEAIKLLETELRAANRELQTAERAWTRQKDALSQTRAEAAAAGIDVKNLAAEQKRLADALATATQKAEAEREAIASLNPAFKTLGTAAEQANATLSKLGIRSASQIQAEILQIQQGLQKLGQNAQVSGADFDRAMLQAQQRITALQAEMRGAADPLTNSLGRSSAAVDDFVGRLTPIAGAITAAFGVAEVARMAADFDSLNRSMAAIQGQGAKAAAEVAYLTDAANRLGLEVQSVSKTYTSWLASIKGTAIEGEKGRAVFESVAGAMAKLGKSAADTDGAMMALGQMVSKGNVSMEELRQQLAERLPGAMQAAAAGAGLTVDQLNRMVESGGVLAEDLLPGLASELNKLYGSSSADGMVSSWNRLKNAVFETAGQIGQTQAVMAAFNGVAGSLKEIVLVLGTGALTAAEGIGLLGKTIGATAAAIQSGNWSMLSDEIGKMATESAARINTLASQTLIAQGVQKAFGDSVQQAGAQAAASASQYLAISAAYTEVNAAAAKQVELSEKTLAARQAEGKAALDFVAQFGTEAEKRAEAADQAALEAAALQRVAEAKQLAANVATAQLAALEAEVAAMEKVSPARKKEIEELQRSTALKQQEAAQATATAQAAEIRAAGLQTETQALADNSKRVTELRAAWQSASAEADTLAAAVKAGAATKEQAAAASIKAGQAEKLYRDATVDATAAVERKLAAEKSAASLQESALKNDLYRAQTILEIAKQRGNERDIAQAQIAVWRIELEIMDAQAKAARLEAEAMLLVAKAKREELIASGNLTEQKKAELALMEANIKAKQLEAEKYDLMAERMRKLNYETNELSAGYEGLSSAADKAAASADKAADSYDGLASSIRSASTEKDKFATNTRGEVITGGPNVSDLAGQYARSPEEAKAIADLFPYYYQKALNDPQNRSTTTGVAYGAAERQAIAEAVAEAQRRQSTAAGQAPQAAGPGTIVKNTYTVDLRTPAGTKTVKVADQASADTLISTLQELAARS